MKEEQLEFDMTERIPKEALHAEDPYALDARIPVEEVPFQYGKVKLRKLENGLWIWGMRYAIPAKGCGGDFHPFRAHGPAYAAHSREEAIGNAISWLKDRFDLSAVKLPQEA